MVSVRCHARRWGACAALGIALAAFALASASGQPKQPGGNTDQTGQRQAPTKQDHTNTAPGATTPVNQAGGGQGAGSGGSQASGGSADGWKPAETVEATSAAFSAAATLALAGFAAVQIWIYNKQTKVMARTLSATRTAAAAASRSAEAADKAVLKSDELLRQSRIGERAWVTSDQPEIAMTKQGAHAYFVVQMKWQNFGRTPAQKCSLRVGQPNYSHAQQENPPMTVVGPGGTFKSDPILIHAAILYGKRTQGPLAGERIRGQISYFDIFEDVERHSEVEMIFSYVSDESPFAANPDDEALIRRLIAGVRCVITRHTAD